MITLALSVPDEEGYSSFNYLSSDTKQKDVMEKLSRGELDSDLRKNISKVLPEGFTISAFCSDGGEDYQEVDINFYH